MPIDLKVYFIQSIQTKHGYCSMHSLWQFQAHDNNPNYRISTSTPTQAPFKNFDSIYTETLHFFRNIIWTSNTAWIFVFIFKQLCVTEVQWVCWHEIQLISKVDYIIYTISTFCMKGHKILILCRIHQAVPNSRQCFPIIEYRSSPK